jgi:hypothetical protein
MFFYFSWDPERWMWFSIDVLYIRYLTICHVMNCYVEFGYLSCSISFYFGRFSQLSAVVPATLFLDIAFFASILDIASM